MGHITCSNHTYLSLRCQKWSLMKRRSKNPLKSHKWHIMIWRAYNRLRRLSLVEMTHVTHRSESCHLSDQVMSRRCLASLSQHEENKPKIARHVGISNFIQLARNRSADHQVRGQNSPTLLHKSPIFIEKRPIFFEKTFFDLPETLSLPKVQCVFVCACLCV